MSIPTIHERLIEKQPRAELERKAAKAVTRSNIWTQEELDAADREADEICAAINPQKE